MASKRRLRRRGCESKIRYATEAEAAAVVRRTRRVHGPVAVYRCGNHWHVGHPPRRVRQSIQARRDNASRESR